MTGTDNAAQVVNRRCRYQRGPWSRQRYRMSTLTL
jgi:hypothetical protein